jgi:hypothetical protein
MCHSCVLTGLAAVRVREFVSFVRSSVYSLGSAGPGFRERYSEYKRLVLTVLRQVWQEVRRINNAPDQTIRTMVRKRKFAGNDDEPENVRAREHERGAMKTC